MRLAFMICTRSMEHSRGRSAGYDGWFGRGFAVRWLRERDKAVARPVSGEDVAGSLRIDF